LLGEQTVAFAVTDDGINLYFEETGAGTPVLFVHEFAADLRGWEPQLRFFGRRHRCIAYNARGYPPSAVPTEVEAYSQARAAADAIAVLDHCGIESAHVVGISMGGFCALHVGLRHPQRARSLVVAGCGYGAQPNQQERFRAENEVTAAAFETEGSPKTAARYALGPTRVQFQNKDRRGWEEFAGQLAEHSAVGSALTLRGVQMRRPSLYGLVGELRQLQVPTLIVTGDEDEGCLEPNIMLKRTIASSALAVLPRTGHACNLEEPELFNRLVADFLATVDGGRWTLRDPRAVTGGLTGMKG
jgi:pimeloyl-ACP methyl ester carboxylesterase